MATLALDLRVTPAPPPFLPQLSVYTALMQASQGHMEAWLQYCTDPDCAIW